MILTSKSQAAITETKNRDVWTDTKILLQLMLSGSYEQFTETNNLYYMGAAIPALFYSFDNDKRISSLAATKDIKNIVNHVGDAGVILSFPVVPAIFYFNGRKNNNAKSINFAMEVTATMYIAMVESAMISYVQVHNRPSTDNVSFWEKSFRGDSSFPSGHVVPYAALFFKTLQFYGPMWSLLPATLTIVSSLQRVQDQKHFLSDVVGAFFLTAFASEGVRKANKFKDNHPVYKWIFEHDVKVSYIHYKGTIGPRLVWSY